MKKLLIASDCFLPRWDGIARFLAELLPYLAKKYKVTVIAPAYEGHVVEIKGVTVVRVPLHKMRVGDFVPATLQPRKIKKLVKDADIVWSHTIGSIGAMAIKYGKKYKKPTISFVHSYEWELVSRSIFERPLLKKFSLKSIKWLTRHFYNKCDLLLVPYDGLIDELRKVGVKSRMDLVHLGVDVKKFCPPKNKNIAKSNIGINFRKKVIGYAGRIEREKDLTTLYNAFSILREKRDDVMLLVVGKGLPFNSIFKDSSNIIEVSGTDNVIPYYQAMDVFALSSLTETTSLATMEAMSCGVPVVTTGVGLIKKYVKRGLNGYLFELRNAEQMAAHLAKIVKNDDLRKEMGSHARKTIMYKYSWDKTVKEIMDVLSEF
ncbi:glycosyltransferase family 4 protein [Candidatus Woesearchaeota archaeon]|nr:glycosyltransferase family 4 protein [Candidatus Woesearchaeota archaeon]